WLRTVVQPSVRARTLDDYAYALRRYVRPSLGERLLTRISPADVRTLCADLSGRFQASTVRKIYNILRSALRAACEDGLIPVNPAQGRTVTRVLPAVQRVERRTIASDDLPRFLEAARGNRWCAYWYVLLCGGLRP